MDHPAGVRGGVPRQPLKRIQRLQAPRDTDEGRQAGAGAPFRGGGETCALWQDLALDPIGSVVDLKGTNSQEQKGTP